MKVHSFKGWIWNILEYVATIRQQRRQTKPPQDMTYIMGYIMDDALSLSQGSILKRGKFGKSPPARWWWVPGSC